MSTTEFTSKSKEAVPFENESFFSKTESKGIGIRHRHSLSAGKIDKLQINDITTHDIENKIAPISAREFKSGGYCNSMQISSGCVNVEELDSGATNFNTTSTRQGDNNPYSLPLYSEANSDSKRISPWIVHSNIVQNPFYSQKDTALRKSATETAENTNLEDELNSSYTKICKSVSALSLDRDTDRISQKDVFADNSKLIETSLKSFSEKQDTSEEVVSESSVETDCSDEPLFDSTKDLITAEANRLIHLNLENPYFLLRFFKLAQKIRSDYQRQKLLISMETMTSSEYLRFFKTKTHKKKSALENESLKDF